MKMNLPQVTLLGIDCINVKRLQAALDISESRIEFGAVKLLTSLPTEDKRLVKISHISSVEEFSRFCIEDLNKYVDTEYVLLVQYDGFVLNPENWNPQFLKYDYIGAPCSWKTGTWTVGNGGFSLRSKKFLETSAKLVREGKISEIHPEDVSMCLTYRDIFEKEGIKFASVDLANKFSVVENTLTYDHPFGFHGLYNKNMDELIKNYPDFPIHIFLPKIKFKRLDKIKEVFKDSAVEGHTFGSFARGDTDLFSDIDVWLTFKDEDIKEALEKRLKLYTEVDDIVHICEPPQNSPANGVHSFVLYKTKVGLFHVDFYLCPLSTSFQLKDSKKIFGDIELPFRELGLNSQKITLPKIYRIDFFIDFIFVAIKRLVRNDTGSLEGIFREYEYLSDRYGVDVEKLENKDYSFDSLGEIIKNIEGVANDKQKKALSEIEGFLETVQKNLEFYQPSR